MTSLTSRDEAVLQPVLPLANIHQAAPSSVSGRLYRKDGTTTALSLSSLPELLLNIVFPVTSSRT